MQPKSANRRFLSFKQEFKNLSIAYPIIGNILRVANLTSLSNKTKFGFVQQTQIYCKVYLLKSL